tara:strand:- start:73 stop:681 length:609 start_codon:yes stop_codon:yes gene_type:complete
MESVDKHPFQNHDKVYNELTVQKLEEIYNELAVQTVEKVIEKKDKRKTLAVFETGFEEAIYNSACGRGFTGAEPQYSDEEPEIEYSCIIIDDFANILKDPDIQKQLSKMMIKARHIKCAFIFTLQSYTYFPKTLRKQITYCTIFKPKNIEEWLSISNELLALNKADALILYDYVFNEPYAHLDLDTTNNRLFKNFNLLKLKK